MISTYHVACKRRDILNGQKLKAEKAAREAVFFENEQEMLRALARLFSRLNLNSNIKNNDDNNEFKYSSPFIDADEIIIK